MAEKLYSINDVAKMTGKSPVTVRQLVRAHNLGSKIGRDWVLRAADITAIRNVPKAGWPANAASKKKPLPSP